MRKIFSALTVVMAMIFIANLALAFEAPGGALYGVTTDGVYYLAKSLVDAANGKPPKVMFQPDPSVDKWVRLEMSLDGSYYVYSSSRKLLPGVKTDFCFDIGNRKYIPHALIQDQRIKAGDYVDNGVGGYNFRLEPK